MLIGILILIAIVAVPAAVIAWLTRAQSKRGCGRGRSTRAPFPPCPGPAPPARPTRE